MTVFFLAVVLVAVALWLQWRWQRRLFENLANRIPGPTAWPIFGNALQIGRTTTDLYQVIQKFSKTYKQRFRIWLGPVLFIGLLDPKDIEVVLSSPKYNDKSIIYNLLHSWLGRGLLTSYGEKWHKHRKLITPTFHFKILENFLVPMNAKGTILIQKLEKEVNGPSFDIYSYVTLYALDAITETAMGMDINAQGDGKSTYVNAVRQTSDIIMRRMMRPWFHPDVLFNMTSDGRKHRQLLKTLHGTTRMVIQKKKKEMKTRVEDTGAKSTDENIGIKKRMAFLDLLLQENLRNESLTDKDIQEEVDTFMFEGHDTTASGLAFTLWLLSRHQNEQEKCYAEVDSLLSGCDNNASTIHILNEMKYLECVIKESMRLYPPVPMMARMLMEDVTIADGVVLPAGANIGFPLSAIHRAPELYPNPDEFIPDRFLLENKVTQNPFAYIPFSAGPRNCIGQKFAMLSMKATISKILSHYKLLPAIESEPVLSVELILKSTNGLKVKITSRNS